MFEDADRRGGRGIDAETNLGGHRDVLCENHRDTWWTLIVHIAGICPQYARRASRSDRTLGVYNTCDYAMSKTMIT